MKKTQILTIVTILTVGTVGYAQCPELAPAQLMEVITNKVSTSTGKTLTLSQIRPKETPVLPLIMGPKFVHSLVFDNDLSCSYQIEDSNGKSFSVVINLKI